MKQSYVLLWQVLLRWRRCIFEWWRPDMMEMVHQTQMMLHRLKLETRIIMKNINILHLIKIALQVGQDGYPF